MDYYSIAEQIEKKGSVLCVGLDPDIEKIPDHYTKDVKGITQFCIDIIHATKDFCIAYKPNLAFFECHGTKGWSALEEIKAAIPDDIFTIVDAKRGDIGNTSKMYARAFFETLGFDAITVAPYMGEDSIRPFLEFEGKWTIVLGLTSNAGSNDFQRLLMKEGEPLFKNVIKKVKNWGSEANTMFVVGATHPGDFTEIRQLVPDHFLLVPGVGAQGGSMQDVITYGKGKKNPGLFVNASRSILYASKGEDCMVKAKEEAIELNKQFIRTYKN